MDGSNDVTTNPFNSVLEVAASGTEGVGWAIPEQWAHQIIDRFGLELVQGRGDMTGEKHAMFEFNGVELRLKYEFPQHWKVYRGAWKTDPHWTGD